MSRVPSGHPLWKWNSSNGKATAEQTIAAYNAASNRGYTEDFSRIVWKSRRMLSVNRGLDMIASTPEL